MDIVKRTYKKLREYCTVPTMVMYGLFVISVIVHISSLMSEGFADFYNRNISSVVRGMLAKATNLLPFSLSETIIMFMPVIIFIFIGLLIKAYKAEKGGNKHAVTRYITVLLAIVTMFYTIFVSGFATAYQGSTLEKKLGLDRGEGVTSEELRETAEILLSKTEELIEEIRFIYGGASVMPYTLNEMNKKLNEAYKSASERYRFVQKLRTNVKYVMLSEAMTYTHISGVYTYYTGEANINTNFPDYTLPYTTAHELSHQRGIAREDEANFMAFLVCLESDDPYILYSGYMNMFEYVVNALYEADEGSYSELIVGMDNRVRYEMISYSKFFDKYRESAASEVSGAINDTYLKSQGQEEGTKSYGRVVDLAVAYYR